MLELILSAMAEDAKQIKLRAKSEHRRSEGLVDRSIKITPQLATMQRAKVLCSGCSKLMTEQRRFGGDDSCSTACDEKLTRWCRYISK